MLQKGREREGEGHTKRDKGTTTAEIYGKSYGNSPRREIRDASLMSEDARYTVYGIPPLIPPRPCPPRTSGGLVQFICGLRGNISHIAPAFVVFFVLARASEQKKLNRFRWAIMYCELKFIAHMAAE